MLPLQLSAHRRIRFVEEDRGFETPCWMWQLGLRGEYPVLTVRFVKWLGHRYFYTQLVGPIPEGHDVHHRCEQKLCVNPDHLSAIAEGEHSRHHNLQRELKEECVRGHPYDEMNTRVVSHRGRKHRQCRSCDRERKRAAYQPRKSQQEA